MRCYRDDMTTETNILSRLSISPVGSFIVYVADDDFYFTAHMDEIHEAHTADIKSGAHPYAAITLTHVEPIEDSVPLTGALWSEVKGAAPFNILEDWTRWCDEVVDALDGDTTGAIVQAMLRTWSVSEDEAARAATL